ncbi:hypothetical protein U9M48_035249 [Paspalum notatum var. saurae]|uniref:indole-3-pyruvate monooxygenase n=1 Tax=Paspalum notatum var. saurae TaxID=547442 RepID=A0AAQ3UCA6_PASNO
MENVLVLIVGAGPSGLAVAACLSQLSIPYCIVESEDCSASLWRKRTYDCLKLHLAKEFCELPHMSYPCDTPKYIPKEYTSVESCKYDQVSNCWDVMAHDQVNDLVMEYTARFLVVATGENSEGVIPEIPGLHGFPGEVIHSSSYKSWDDYAGKGVLVIGCGNSGMEIAYDLVKHGVDTSIVIHSPVRTYYINFKYNGLFFHACWNINHRALLLTLLLFSLHKYVQLHVMTKGLINLVSIKFADFIIVTLANIGLGDLSRYGILRPNMGPLLLKAKTGRSAVIDVGTTEFIKKEAIKVLGPISCIRGNCVEFEDGKKRNFDSLVFATGYGYESTANMWLKDDMSLLNDNGMPKRAFLIMCKGENGLYCVGMAMRGLAGISHDAKKVAADIKSIVDSMGLF